MRKCLNKMFLKMETPQKEEETSQQNKVLKVFFQKMETPQKKEEMPQQNKV